MDCSSWARAPAVLALLMAQLCSCRDDDATTSSTGSFATSTASSGTTTGAGGGGTAWEARCHDGWCLIPSGKFLIGSPEDEWGRGAYSEDQVEVTLTRNFLLQQYEVTIPEWTRFGWENPSSAQLSYGSWCQESTCPIGHLNWFDVVSYANALSTADGYAPCYDLINCTGAPGAELRCDSAALTAPSVYDCPGYRLPTEAEWEYAARAGTTTAFYSGAITPQADWGTCYHEPNLDSVAWYCHNSGDSSHPVGLKGPNPAGLFDILGNGIEWMHNDAQGAYGSQPLVDPFGEMNSADSHRELRGGGFNYVSDLLRAASHYDARWDGAGATIRLARTLGPDETW
ncbi:MAG: formylglycine-generating enzyme family protein [Polyangiaceae bacterium]|nr:formylglycine-generating enzyme family protein [Polyangiaceae bacterium]